MEKMNDEKDMNVAVTHPSKLRKLKDSGESFMNFVYNSDTKEILGRDGMSWAKISLFYGAFYTGLASFFVIMLAIFGANLSIETPRYILDSSIIGSARDDFTGKAKVNPGLGFRPQIDVEASLIAYKISKPTDKDSGLKMDFSTLKSSLKTFLDFNNDEKNFFNIQINSNHLKKRLNCQNEKLETSIENLNQGFHCEYNYTKVLENTTCSPSNNFGYLTEQGPCVAIKLNRIYDWLPLAYETIDDKYFAMNMTEIQNRSVFSENVFIQCTGYHASDMDALNRTKISYYSENSKLLNINSIGMIPFYYFPYKNQPGYQSPMVFVHFRNIPKFQLINVICRAFAKNIDSDDR